MSTIAMSTKEYRKLKKDLEEIKAYMRQLATPQDSLIDNATFMKVMGISEKTAITWRKEKKISYSKKGKKIYYRWSDIEAFLDAHFVAKK